MRLVKIKLREPNQFWIMGPIALQQDKDISPFLNVDLLTDRQAQVINRSVGFKEITLIGADDEVLTGGLESANFIEGNFVSTEDISEKDDILPEIVSVTVPMEESEEEEDEEISEELIEEARILISKNGNTVRAIIKSLPLGAKSLSLLHTCHEIELDGKNRAGVLNEIQSRMMEC